MIQALILWILRRRKRRDPRNHHVHAMLARMETHGDN